MDALRKALKDDDASVRRAAEVALERAFPEGPGPGPFRKRCARETVAARPAARASEQRSPPCHDRPLCRALRRIPRPRLALRLVPARDLRRSCRPRPRTSPLPTKDRSPCARSPPRPGALAPTPAHEDAEPHELVSRHGQNGQGSGCRSGSCHHQSPPRRAASPGRSAWSPSCADSSRAAWSSAWATSPACWPIPGRTSTWPARSPPRSCGTGASGSSLSRRPPTFTGAAWAFVVFPPPNSHTAHANIRAPVPHAPTNGAQENRRDAAPSRARPRTRCQNRHSPAETVSVPTTCLPSR